jgi:hypothetical protein
MFSSTRLSVDASQNSVPEAVRMTTSLSVPRNSFVSSTMVVYRSVIRSIRWPNVDSVMASITSSRTSVGPGMYSVLSS